MLGLGKRRKQILFFSRGKGRGHAIPDAAIANELVVLEPALDITFASYSVGAATLKDLGQNVTDLDLPEDNPLWDTLLRVVPLLQQRRPALVVSHEEFCVLPLCKAFGLSAVYLTDWFTNPDSIQMQALKYAEQVIFLDDPGIYDEPPYLVGKVLYAGYVLRPLDSAATDKAQSRRGLGLPPDSTVILVSPGGSGMHSEARAPLFDLVLDAYDSLKAGDKRLLWVAGEPDYSALVEKSRDRHDLMILKPHYNFTPTIMAADVVITKGNRLPLFECEALGIPSISISYGHNPIDDCRVSQIRTNIALRARGLDTFSLRDYMLKALNRASEIPVLTHATDPRSPVRTGLAETRD
jgi:UDP-N-acetylglucosamine:LPS N-acetylglucosamine transferase